MDAADTTMLWMGIVMEVSGIVVLIPEPPSVGGSLGEGARPEHRQGAAAEHGQCCDTGDPERTKFERQSRGLLNKWRPWIGVVLLFAALAFLMTVAVAIT